MYHLKHNKRLILCNFCHLREKKNRKFETVKNILILRNYRII